MTEVISQALGILCMACCIISPMMQKKWQMLSFSAAANFFNVVNFFMFGHYSASLICFVAIAQVLVNIRHSLHGNTSSLAEKIIFTVLYLACGLITYSSPQDLMPMAGSLLFMCSVFLQREQNIRKVSLVSNAVWIIYDVLTRSTAIYAQLVSTLFLVIALIKYRERPAKEDAAA